MRVARLFGQLFDRDRIGASLKYVEPGATRSCGILLREPDLKSGEPEPALFYGDGWRVVIMPMKDNDPTAARSNGDYFPTATYVVESRRAERDGDNFTDQSASTSVVTLGLNVAAGAPAVPAPGRLVVRCEPPDEPRISTEFGGNRVVAALSASGAWFIPACLTAEVTAIVGGEKG